MPRQKKTLTSVGDSIHDLFSGPKRRHSRSTNGPTRISKACIQSYGVDGARGSNGDDETMQNFTWQTSSEDIAWKTLRRHFRKINLYDLKWLPIRAKGG